MTAFVGPGKLDATLGKECALWLNRAKSETGERARRAVLLRKGPAIEVTNEGSWTPDTSIFT